MRADLVDQIGRRQRHTAQDGRACRAAAAALVAHGIRDLSTGAAGAAIRRHVDTRTARGGRAGGVHRDAATGQHRARSVAGAARTGVAAIVRKVRQRGAATAAVPAIAGRKHAGQEGRHRPCGPLDARLSGRAAVAALATIEVVQAGTGHGGIAAVPARAAWRAAGHTCPAVLDRPAGDQVDRSGSAPCTPRASRFAVGTARGGRSAVATGPAAREGGQGLDGRTDRRVREEQAVEADGDRAALPGGASVAPLRLIGRNAGQPARPPVAARAGNEGANGVEN